MDGADVEAFPSWLVGSRHVAASTHKQALSALLFFFGKVPGVDLPWMTEFGRPRAKQRLPVVLTPDEVAQVLCFLEGEDRLFAQSLYGTGMRINEGLQLRVKDIDFGRGTIIVREGKGRKDRAVMLPRRLVPGLREQLMRARRGHDHDLHPCLEGRRWRSAQSNGLTTRSDHVQLVAAT